MSEIGGAPEGTAHSDTDESGSQVRGSSLLLSGRLVSSGISYLTQILIVRYLAKSDYGAFAYALSMVALIQAAIQLGLDRGLARYLPIYDEDSDTGSILGSITFVTAIAAGLGTIIAVGYWATRSMLEGGLIEDPVAISVLAILVVLAPIEALDNVLVTILAAFRKTGAIFLRRHIVAPLLKLSVVGLLIATSSSVRFLAIGYTFAGILGLAVFAGVLGRFLSERRSREPDSRFRLPVRELLTFSLPLLTTDLVFMAVSATDAFMLEFFGSTADVAALRAVQPTAKLNQLALSAFGVLYIPYIARLFARGRHEELGRRYWDTANWVMVLSLPVLALCLLFPEELTTRLLGEAYADSAVILGVLAGGYFIHAMFGFNGMTLNVYREVGFLVGINLVAVAANIGLNLALIPKYGPLGAAIGTAGTFLVHNIAKQYGVIRRAGLPGAPPKTWRLYLVVALVATIAGVVGYGTEIGLGSRSLIWISLVIAILAVGRRTVQIDSAFPGLVRVPVIRHLFK